MYVHCVVFEKKQLEIVKLNPSAETQQAVHYISGKTLGKLPKAKIFH